MVVNSPASVLRSQRMVGSWSMPCTTKPEMKLALRPMSPRSSLRGVLTATSWWPITSQESSSVSSPATRLTWQRYQNICLISLSNNFLYRRPIPKVIDLNRRLIVRSLMEIHHRGLLGWWKDWFFGVFILFADWVEVRRWPLHDSRGLHGHFVLCGLHPYQGIAWKLDETQPVKHTPTDKCTVTCSAAQCAVCNFDR